MSGTYSKAISRVCVCVCGGVAAVSRHACGYMSDTELRHFLSLGLESGADAGVRGDRIKRFPGTAGRNVKAPLVH